MTGPEAISVLRYQGNRIPIVMTTSRSNTVDVEKVFKLGVAEYLLKPFDIHFLINKIHRVTGKELTY
jgi:DNA-binding response OmpR family regulator